MAKTILKDIIWRIVSTRPFDSVRPRINHSNVYRLEGKTKNLNSDLSTVVFGRNETAEYFSRLIFVGKPKFEFLGERTFSDIPFFAEEASEDFFIVETNWSLSSFLLDKGFFILPQINFVLDISDSLELIQNRMNISKIRRIKKLLRAGYSFETTKDPTKLHSFYYEMYLPHMLTKHGKSARPVSFSECRRLFLKGDLLLIKQGQNCVAGIILVPHGDELYQPLIAVKDIDKEMTMGSYATTYYTIVFGKQKGYARVDFGDAPPFLQDGLFQYKREWGMRIRPVIGGSAQVFAARLSNRSEATKDFLSTNPFIFLEDKNLRGLTYLSSEAGRKTEFLNVPGLSSLLIVSSGIEGLNLDSSRLGNRLSENASGQVSSSLKQLIGLCHEDNWVINELWLRN